MAEGSRNNKKAMTLTARITVAIIALVIIPIILTIAMFIFLTNWQSKQYRQQYGLEDVNYDTMYNNTLLLLKETDKDFTELKEMIRDGRIDDPEACQSFNERMEKNHSYLVVRKNGVIRFNGMDVAEDALWQLLPEFQGASTQSGIQMVNQFLIRQVDYEKDNALCSAFIITSTNQMATGMRSWITALLLACIVILAITALGVALWIYSGVMNPIKKLRKATQNIRDGNLDFEISGSSVTEINELCVDFDEMRRKFLESQEEKERFDQGSRELISNITHDLKTPITAVKGYVEGIMDGVADTPEKMDRYIRTIYNKANEMDRLINELTFYTKIDTNRIPYSFGKILAAEFFDDCAEKLGLDATAQQIRFTYENDLEPDTVIIADVEQLMRVIQNIFNNSVKYMDKPEKEIGLHVLDEEDFIRVNISDNGCGIDKKDLTAVFDRFYRTDASRNSTRGGSGIGLSIVKKILEDHGGKVWAQSEKGEGTTICFVLRKYREATYDE